MVKIPEVPDRGASGTVHYFAFAAGRKKQVPRLTFHTPPYSTSVLLGRKPPPSLQYEQSAELQCVSETFPTNTSLNKARDVALSPRGGPF